MNDEKPIMLRLISSAVSVASRAGAEVRRIAKTGQLAVIDKGIHDFQTEADRTAQRLIVASLSKKFPKCKIVGEEDLEDDKEADASLLVETCEEDILKIPLPKEYQNVREEDLTIWVDPLDGTTEFVRGYLEHVTVLIGISLDGKSVAGVINQPFYNHKSDVSSDVGRTIWSLCGLGCYGITAKDISNDKFIVTTTVSHRNKNIEDTLQMLKPDGVLKVGGAGHKVLQVIEGKAHSYVFASKGCKRWDTSAPEAILKSLGGKLTDVHGNDINYQFRLDGDYLNYLGVIASRDEASHMRVLQNIPKAVKDNLDDFMAKNMQPNL